MPIEIVPYYRKYVSWFELIRDFLKNSLQAPASIEHVGSTAVIGLGGKEVIDVMIIVNEKIQMLDVVSSLKSAGYRFDERDGLGVFPERYFISGQFFIKNKEIHVHYHVTFSGSNEHED